MHYIIETSADGSRRKVYEKPAPTSQARMIYASKKGSKPLNIGMNQAKRVARHADKRDRALVVKVLGGGLPKHAKHHQELVQRRHRYYAEQISG